ncbi:hypothetical protein ACQ4M4_00880 [Leptolyngbya sp. AN02str]|uniref:hypothetical protein n=1 Tax=Leptolyngbya sp. AN02str TaxID=3423363 RepID=UPI003D31B003
MAFIPPVLLVLDISALSGGTTREWLEFSRVGKVHVPQPVYEEMRLLFDRSPDPDLEELAKSFSHFYPTSGWQVVDVTAHHSSLTAVGQALTRRSRTALAAARCAYALSLNFSNHLVVLVTNDQGLLQRVYDIPSNNFCAINASALMQWSRTGQRPVAVSQKLQQLRASISANLSSGLVGQTRSTSATRTSVGTTTKPATRPSSTVQRPQRRLPGQSYSPDTAESISNMISLMLAVGGVAVAGWLLWSMFSNVNWFEPLRQPLDPTQQNRQ